MVGLGSFIKEKGINMKELLKKLRETIQLEPSLIQFKLDDKFYELASNKRGEWFIYNLFGPELDLNTNKLKNKSKEQVEKILKDKYSNIDIY